MPELKMPEKLTPLLYPKKFKVIYGGRGGAKSLTVGQIILMRVATEGIKVAAMREMMNSIDDSVHSLFCDEISNLGLSGFTIYYNRITHENGGEITYKGLARNPESVKSMHGYSLFWVEEASTLSKKSLDLLIPTLRKEESELWLTFNPGSSADPISQEFLLPFDNAMVDGCYEDDLNLIIKINYIDNPFFPDNLEQLRLKHYKTKQRAEYDHIWMGAYNDQVENSIISAEEFDAAIDAHKKLGFKPKGKKIVSFDPADQNGDAKGLSLRHGSVVLDVLQSNAGDVNDGCDWATGYAVQKNANVFIWDADGLGLSLRRQVSDGFKGFEVEQQAFRGGRTPDRADSLYEPIDDNSARAMKNKDAFKNQRAQYYWALRDRFYKTYRAVEFGEYCDPDEMISISSEIKDLNLLRSEVCRIPRKPNGNGQIQILSKPEMRNLDIKSPNMADTLMMSMAIPDRIGKKRQPLHVKRVGIV